MIYLFGTIGALIVLALLALIPFFGMLYLADYLFQTSFGGAVGRFLLMSVKNLRRNLLRTSLTYLAVFMLVAIVTMVWSVLYYLDDLMTERAKDIKVVVQEKWQAGSRMPFTYAGRLAEGGADPSMVDDKRGGMTPLVAVMTGPELPSLIEAERQPSEEKAIAAIDFLLDHGVAPTITNGAGTTALHLAAFFGKAESTRILLEAGAEVNVYSRNALGVQPLHSAAAGRHIEVCRLLVAAGADVDARQREDYTPLHEAAQHGDPELVELTFLIGYINLLNLFNNSLQVRYRGDYRALLDRVPST